MSRTLCDWSKKDIQRHAEELLQIVTPQLYLCEKCARTACDDRYLCRGLEIAKLERKLGLEPDARRHPVLAGGED